ncbi:hypothetical protein ACRRTK_011418 [Alexandromys fortis]
MRRGRAGGGETEVWIGLAGGISGSGIGKARRRSPNEERGQAVRMRSEAQRPQALRWRGRSRSPK